VLEVQRISKQSIAALSEILDSTQLESVGALAAFDLHEAGDRLADYEKAVAVNEELVREFVGVGDEDFATVLERMECFL
jgi:hypothetical protein